MKDAERRLPTLNRDREETAGVAFAGGPWEDADLRSSGPRGETVTQIEALRREIERWHAMSGGDRSLLEALLHHSPHGIIICDRDGRFVLQNRAAERIWGGSATVEGVDGWGRYRAFHEDWRPFEADDWSMARCLSRRAIVEAEEVRFQRFDGTFGILLGSCAPILNAKGELEGALSVFADITELKEAEARLQQARAEWAARTERLLRITSALADAVTPGQVTAAVVDRTAEELGASSCGLWLLGEDGTTASLVRGLGYSEASRARFAKLVISPEAKGEGPVWDAFRMREAQWIESPEEYRERYPKASWEPVIPVHTIACLPLVVEGRTIGMLVFTFSQDRGPHVEDRSLLVVVAQHCAQALERTRVLHQAQLAYAETELLYRLTDAVNRAQSTGEVYEASLDTIQRALGIERAAILCFDEDMKMRFATWRGLSDEYRAAVDGHSPWQAEARDPESIFVDDVTRDASLADFRELFAREKIGALAFVPLVYEGRLLGKFMLYMREPRVLTPRERSVTRSIADQVASAIGRRQAQEERELLIDRLSQTVRLNELFVGVLGHDLRNPLTAIMNTAQLALRRDEGERMTRPLSRILSAGERMTRMIEQLLDFTRARVGGGLLLDPVDTDLEVLGRHVLGEVQDANPDRVIEVSTEGSLEGYWDTDRLAQVLSNLASNAVQHGAPGSKVKVLLDGTRDDAVILRFTNEGVVRPDVLTVLFEPFRGAEMRRDRSGEPSRGAAPTLGKGLGLGLFITQQIVRAHGGSIEVRSSAEEGTVFVVTLPRTARAQGGPGGASDADQRWSQTRSTASRRSGSTGLET